MIIFFIAIIALIIGSFVSCVSYRMAKHQSWMITRSKCPKCEHPLKIRNLLPLLSWLFQKGRCDYCRSKISWRYPIIELSCMLIFLLIYFASKNILNLNFILVCTIATIFLLMCIIDIEEYFIPNALQYFLAIITLVFIVSNQGAAHIASHITSAFLYGGFGLALYLLFRYMAGAEALGIDDIKLLFNVGFLLGNAKFLAFILMSGIFGIIFGLTWMKFKKDETFPFAPALCLAAFVNLLIKKFSLVDVIGSLLFLQSF